MQFNKRTIAYVPIALSLVSCSGDNQESKSMEQIYAENGVPVRTEIIQKEPIRITLSYNAVLTGIRESDASAMVADRVETIYKSVGDFVEKDEIVISFPSDNPTAQYRQAKVAYDHARTTLQRMENLYNGGGISLQELENVRTETQVAEANWEAVRQSIKIKAPISGIITQMNVFESNNVQPGDILFKVSDTQRLKAHLWVSESAIQSVKIGDEAFATWNHLELPGEIVQIDQALNTENQAFGLLVEFDNPELKVMSGINAEIHLISQSEDASIWIERKNLVRLENGKAVYIADNGTARLTPVQTGGQINLDIEITHGLEPGDTLISSSQPMLVDGIKINIVK